MASYTKTQRRDALLEAGKLLDVVAEQLRDVDEDLLDLVVRDLRVMLGELDTETITGPEVVGE